MIKENFNPAMRRRVKELRPASSEEISQILEACETLPKLHLVRDVVRILANTGIRNSELMSLRMSDVDLDAGWLTVSSGSKASWRRSIPLRPKTIAAIKSLHRLNQESERVLGDFPLRRMRYVVARLRPMWPKLPRGRLVLYSLRLNFVCRLMAAGIPASVVRYCLGHRDLSNIVWNGPPSPEEKLQIVRRNLERFLAEL
jgi:integrase